MWLSVLCCLLWAPGSTVNLLWQFLLMWLVRCWRIFSKAVSVETGFLWNGICVMLAVTMRYWSFVSPMAAANNISQLNEWSAHSDCSTGPDLHWRGRTLLLQVEEGGLHPRAPLPSHPQPGEHRGILYLSSPNDMSLLILERQQRGKREGEDERERNSLLLALTEITPAAQVCALIGIKHTTFWCMDDTLSTWATQPGHRAFVFHTPCWVPSYKPHCQNPKDLLFFCINEVTKGKAIIFTVGTGVMKRYKAVHISGK